MVTFEELRQASNEAYQAGEVERAKRIKADALQAVDLRDQALSIQKGMTESAFTGIGRGIKAAPVTIAQGLLESGAAAYDAAMDTNYASSVSDSFEEFKKEIAAI